MESQKISELDVVTSVSGAEIIPVVVGGATKSATSAQIATYAVAEVKKLNYATTTTLSSYLTKTDAANTYQPKGSYLTEHQKLPTTLPNPSAITVMLNGGSTEGTNKFTYTGSAAMTVNITAAAIGAATASHTHSNYALATALTALTERVAALETDVAALKNPEQTE